FSSIAASLRGGTGGTGRASFRTLPAVLESLAKVGVKESERQIRSKNARFSMRALSVRRYRNHPRLLLVRATSMGWKPMPRLSFYVVVERRVRRQWIMARRTMAAVIREQRAANQSP